MLKSKSKSKLAAPSSILRTVVELDPKDVESKWKLARLMLLGNELDQALELVNAADVLDSQNAKVLAVKAAILLRLNDSVGAKREAQAALNIDPSNAGALVVLAAERLARGDANGALLILDREPAAHIHDIGVQLLKSQIIERESERRSKPRLCCASSSNFIHKRLHSEGS